MHMYMCLSVPNRGFLKLACGQLSVYMMTEMYLAVIIIYLIDDAYSHLCVLCYYKLFTGIKLAGGMQMVTTWNSLSTIFCDMNIVFVKALKHRGCCDLCV